ncbi:MAG: hypothetical protein ABIF09_10810 [Gemmatimonadota bacterium]
MGIPHAEDIRLEGSVLRFSFGEVLEDSRCPVDVTCVWAGNAKVVIGIAAGMGPSFLGFRSGNPGIPCGPLCGIFL